MASHNDGTISHSPLAGHPPPSLEIFHAWLDSNSISRDPYIGVEWDDQTGWGVRANRDIGIGTVLCTIPKSTIISHRTASFDRIHHLPDEPSSTDVILHLTACLLYELHLAEESRWFGYLQIIPRQTISIPTLWSVKEIAGEDGELALAWLEGSEASKEMHRKEEEGSNLIQLQEYYNSISRFFPSASPPFLSFLYAYSLVSTRAFVIDAYHTIGIIPFCDMFNHSSLSPHTSLLCDRYVCPTCGSTLACEHESQSDDERQEWLDNLTLAYIRMLEEEGGNTVDMRAERDLKMGEEVFSCYEEGLGDGKLLVEWGFVEGGVGGDGLVWNARDVLDREDLPVFVGILRGGNAGATGEDILSGTVEEDEGFKVGEGKADDSNHTPKGIHLPTSTSRRRIIAPADPTRPFGLINITTQGEISVNLIVAMSLRAGILNQVESEDEAEAEINNVIRAIIERDAKIGNEEERSASLMAEAKVVVEAIINLIDSRLQRYYRPDLTVNQLTREHRTVSTVQKLQSLAMSISLDERILLSRSRQRLGRLLQEE